MNRLLPRDSRDSTTLRENLDRNSRFSHRDLEDKDAIAEPGELIRGSRGDDSGAGVLGVDVREAA